MSWPTMSDYQEAIQNPAQCFTDPELKAGSTALNALGLPQPVTGGFCSVYQVTSAKSRWAVRCFLHNFADQRERYAEISKYLKGRRPRQMVGFEYVGEGIRVRKHWHPVLKMEWVDGETLSTWVGRHVRDAGALRKLDERWAELLDELEKHHIGHCDLQHGNVLVDGAGQLRLIDYDGMYVPSLHGRGSHEKGHPAYQHPQRDGEHFDERVDRFPALVVHVSLLALMQDASLWDRHHDDDNLIFMRGDFVDPDRSRVFAELTGMGGEVAERAKLLRDACRARYDEAPRLRDVRGGKARSGGKVLALPAIEKPSLAEAGAAFANVTGALASLWRKVSGGEAVNVESGEVAEEPAAEAPPAPKPRVKAAKAPATVAVANGANGKATGSRPAWLSAVPAPAPATATRPQPAAPRPRAAVAAALHVPASAPLAIPPGGTRPATHLRPGTRRTTVRATTGPVGPHSPEQTATGWGHEWTRPGESQEQHIWKTPVFTTREVPRTLFGLSLGTRRERFAERHEERIVERGHKVAGHRAQVNALAFTPDGRLLASGGRDGTLRLWHVSTGREVCAALGTRSAVRSLALIPGRNMLAAACANGRLVLWDYGLPRRIVHLGAPDRSRILSVAVSDDGRTLAAGVACGRVHLWPLDGSEWAGEVTGITGGVHGLAFTPDSRALVCATRRGRLECFESDSGEARWRVKPASGRVHALCMPAKGGAVLGATASGHVLAWALGDGSEQADLRPVPERITSLGVSPDARQLLVGTSAGRASLCEAASGDEQVEYAGHPGAVTAAALSADARIAATGCADGSVRLWRER